MTDPALSPYEKYLRRFHQRYGDKPEGAFVKFGHVMVQRLGPTEFEERLDHFVRIHDACKRMLMSEATISEAVTMEFEEAAAWILLVAPDLLQLFAGEVGDPAIEDATAGAVPSSDAKRR